LGLVIPFGLKSVSSYFGASLLEQSSLMIAGLIYGLVGTRYVFALLDRLASIAKRQSIMVIIGILYLLLLNAPTIIVFTWLAVNLKPGSPWHLRAFFVISGCALIVAAIREIMDNAIEARKPE
jgi:hypothetical protein